tara:strand:+ start:1049 stop:1210 length:162 start_codon:yes stop_codon:yes gene_type:complete
MKKLIFLLFIVSCSSKGIDTNNNINFSNNLSFNEFKNLLKIYAEKSSYPNIDD